MNDLNLTEILKGIKPIITNPTGKRKHPSAWQAQYLYLNYDVIIGASTEANY